MGMRVWTGFIWLRLGTNGKLDEQSTEPFVSVKAANFFTS
jgi:hypothetical protein